ncbi:glutaminase-like [Neocloeon triangulifer]|uniref:glutaminase-like n=1 Tax=Neocloeon triangulifer TaxID=2078957 RepID=UPI00286F97FB|nr:glutaminase-like [Neocloeon triangulifer]
MQNLDCEKNDECDALVLKPIITANNFGWAALKNQLRKIFQLCEQNDTGILNSSIPELQKQDPSLWAATVMLVETNQVVNFGPATDTRFTIQSIVKVLLYAYAANHLGMEEVFDHIKCRGFAVPYNSDAIVEGCAPNACLNSGALTASFLILNRVHPDLTSWYQVFLEFQAFVKRICGGPIKCDYETYLSEIATAGKNRTIISKLQESGAIPLQTDCEDILQFYTSCCSLLVNTRQLAHLGLMLAKNGTGRSGVRILEARVAQACLAQMMQAGLYEETGDLFASTGLIAKSGVSGGLVAVSHKKLAVGLFSPRLNAYGNSARALQFLKELSCAFPAIQHWTEDNFEF